MATMEHLFSRARRIPRSQLSLFIRHRLRPLSSSSESNPQHQPSESAVRSKVEPVQIQPVSYSIKPKSESSEEQQPQPPHLSPRLPPHLKSDSGDLGPPRRNVEAAGAFTREEARFMKDAPTILPVSYAKKVAPLPEDRDAAAEGKEKGIEEGTELGSERRRIQAEDRVMKRVFRAAQVEEKEVPLPTLIKVEKKQSDTKIYDLQEAIRQVKALAKRNFDETLEAHVNLGIDRRRSDLAVNGAVVLPHGTGKVVRVAVFAEGAEADEAKAAGADVVGGNELIQQIKNGSKINFDKCIATHSMMQRVASISRILKGLTPNAKKGTVTNNVAVAVKEAKQGLLDFRMKDAIVHVGLGKVSYSEDALRENVGAFVNALLLAKPAGLKKTSKYAGYVNSFHLCSTMGPGFPISIQSLSRAADLYAKAHAR